MLKTTPNAKLIIAGDFNEVPDVYLSLRFWSDVSAFLFLQRNFYYILSLKDVICTYSHKSKIIEYVVNFYILQGKYYIHKQKFAKCIPSVIYFYQKWKLWKSLQCKLITKRMSYC